MASPSTWSKQAAESRGRIEGFFVSVATILATVSS
jgi:hypothetical protein